MCTYCSTDVKIQKILVMFLLHYSNEKHYGESEYVIGSNVLCHKNSQNAKQKNPS